ncbi:MAG: hypothetical protein ACP5O0_06100 [Acidimicrobiales bacterium]
MSSPLDLLHTTTRIALFQSNLCPMGPTKSSAARKAHSLKGSLARSSSMPRLEALDRPAPSLGEGDDIFESSAASSAQAALNGSMPPDAGCGLCELEARKVEH